MTCTFEVILHFVRQWHQTRLLIHLLFEIGRLRVNMMWNKTSWSTDLTKKSVVRETSSFGWKPTWIAIFARLCSMNASVFLFGLAPRVFSIALRLDSIEGPSFPCDADVDGEVNSNRSGRVKTSVSSMSRSAYPTSGRSDDAIVSSSNWALG